jgi:hypothetical protein
MAELSILRGYRGQKLFNEDLANAKNRRKLSELALENAPEDRKFLLASREQTQKEWGFKNQAEQISQINNWSTFAINQLGMANNATDFNATIARMQRDQGLPDEYARPFVMDPNLTGEAFEAARKDKLTKLSSIKSQMEQQMELFKHDLAMKEQAAKNQGLLDLEAARGKNDISLESLRHSNNLAEGPRYAPSELGRLMEEQAKYPPGSPERQQYQQLIDNITSRTSRDYTLSDRFKAIEMANEDYDRQYADFDPGTGAFKGYKEKAPPRDQWVNRRAAGYINPTLSDLGGGGGGKDEIDVSGLTVDNVGKAAENLNWEEESISALFQELIKAGKTDVAQALQEATKEKEKYVNKKKESKETLKDLGQANPNLVPVPKPNLTLSSFANQSTPPPDIKKLRSVGPVEKKEKSEAEILRELQGKMADKNKKKQMQEANQLSDELYKIKQAEEEKKKRNK